MNEVATIDDSKRQVWRAAIITVSDSRAAVAAAISPVSASRAAGRPGDASCDVIAERLESLPADVVARTVVADSVDDIRAAVRERLASVHMLVLTGRTRLRPP